MDPGQLTEKLRQGLQKYRYFLIVLLAGILLMSLPERKETVPEAKAAPSETAEDLEARLSQMLSLMEGTGTVRVLLTQAQGERIQYQCDEDLAEGDRRKKTVLVRSADRMETGLIRQIDPPRFQGALVLCQGGDRADLRLAIVQAVTSVTGLTSDRVTVLKMK